MPDREKVIAGLECCIPGDGTNNNYCEKCPYGGKNADFLRVSCETPLLRDALALLKEQGIPSWKKVEIRVNSKWEVLMKLREKK